MISHVEIPSHIVLLNWNYYGARDTWKASEDYTNWKMSNLVDLWIVSRHQT